MAYDKQKQQQFKIDVDANEIALIKENEFEGTITATLTRGSRAVPDQQVQLFLAGQPLGDSLQTDENGKVVKDFNITTTAKSISVEAQTVGFATRAKKFIALPRPEKEKTKRPAFIIPRESGSADDYKLTYAVLAQDKTPIAGAIVEITGTTYRGPKNLRPTDEKGTTSHNVKFSEKELVFIASVRGSDVSTWINLFNRKEKRNGTKPEYR